MAYDENKDFDDNYNVSEDIILRSSSVTETAITPRDLMSFAKWILFVLAIHAWWLMRVFRTQQ